MTPAPKALMALSALSVLLGSPCFLAASGKWELAGLAAVDTYCRISKSITATVHLSSNEMSQQIVTRLLPQLEQYQRPSFEELNT